MPLRGSGLLLAVLVALLRFDSSAATLEQAGYATVATVNLAPLGNFSPADVHVDDQGFVYVVGTTYTAPAGAQRIGAGGESDILLIKFDPGGQIIYKTVLGGEGHEYANAIAVDSSGHVTIVGNTWSTNFPLQNAVHSVRGDAYTWFVSRLMPDGATLVYSTYYGTGSYDNFQGLAVAPNGDAIVVGSTFSTQFPVTSNAVQKVAAFTANGYSSDAVIVRFAAQGSNVVFSTYLGGMAGELEVFVALDPSGASWVAGTTTSPDFPITPDAAQGFPDFNSSTAFLTKLSDDGTLLYSTLWDTERYERVTAVSFAPNGTMLLATSAALSLQSPAPPTLFGGDGPFRPELPEPAPRNEGSVTVLNPLTGQLLSRGRIGGLGYNGIRRVAADSQNKVHVIGNLLNGPFLAEFNPADSRVERIFYIDDCAYASINGLAVGPGDELVVSTARFDDEFNPVESFLRKLAPSLPPPTNHAPVIYLTRYQDFPGFFGRDPFTIAPGASDIDGTIRDVQLFAGTTLIARLTNAPYKFAWTNAPYGQHSVRAVATDNHGLSSTSCPALFAFAPPPENDSFYRSKIVAASSFSVTGTTTGATPDPAEPYGWPGSDVFYYTASSSPSVWWCWRAPRVGAFALEIEELLWTHTVTVFTGTDLEHLSSLGMGHRVPFRAVGGRAYYFRVIGEGEYVMSLAAITTPANDNFADGTPISGAPLSLRAENFNATFEPGLPAPAEDVADSVWWKWTAIEAGVYKISLVSTAYQSVAVFPVADYNSYTSVVVRAAAGGEFDIRIGNGTGHFELRIDSLLPPPNDNFADAISLAGFPVSVSGSLLGGTSETNEPYAPYSWVPRSSVWYRWTAPETTPVIVEVSSPFSSVLFSVYTGSSFNDMVEQTRASNFEPTARLMANAGTEYLISVDTAWGSTTEEFTLTLRSPHHPANDRFADRIPVTQGAFGSTTEATIGSLEAGYLQGETESIWYSWVAPATGDYTLVTRSYGFYGRAAVFTLGDVDNLVPVAAQTNTGLQFLRFPAIAGTEYQIMFVSSQGGALAFRIRPSQPPPNDNFQNATPLSGAPVVAEGSNVDATLEPGESSQRKASVWWSWTAPHSGQFVVSIPRSTASPALQVYQGTQLSNIVLVAVKYGLANSVLFDAVAGAQYRIVIYGQTDQQGEFTLAITPIDRPPNDDFANATVLAGSKPSARGTTLGATAESGETAPSVWWKWTAPASGGTSIELSLERRVELFVGASLQALTPVAMWTGFPRWPMIFTAQAGVTYYIRVSEYAFTPFTLSLNGPAILERPTLTRVTRDTYGLFQFSLDALIGTTNIIETSSDLQHWSAISTNLTDCFPYPVVAPPSAQSHLFYRVRLVK